MTGSRSLRIAHVDTERTWRGGEQQVFSLISGLARQGHHNLAVVRKGGALGYRLEDAHLPVFRLSPVGEFDLLSALFLRMKLRQERIDVVHAHTGHAVALAALATAGTGIPFVLTRRVDFHLSKNPFSRWKYGRAAKIISISDGVRRILLQDGIPDSSIVTIPSGIDLTRLDAIEPALRSSYGAREDSLVIGQVAAMVPHKDPMNLLRAAATLMPRYPRLILVYVGDGPLEGELRRRAADLGIAERVKFLGYRTDALSLLASFDVFCLSSEEEGLGTSILDAMALGVPVVGTAVGGIPELIEDGISGYLAPAHDSAALAQALERAAHSTAKTTLRAGMSEKVRKFDITHTISGVVSLYRQIVDQNKRI